MDEDKSIEKTDRRNFLKIATVGSVAGGAAIVMGSPAQAENEPPSSTGGYAKTAHVQTYYDTTKF